MSDKRDQGLLRRRTRPDFTKGNSRPIQVVDLFSGCGGMTLGMALAVREIGRPLSIPLAIDFEANAVSVFRENFPRADVRLGGVEQYFDGELGDSATQTERASAKRLGVVDVLLGGPPCQGNSDLNNHTRRADPRNQLYARMGRAAEVLRPKIVIIENVPAVVHDRNRVVDVTVSCLRSAGYSVAARVLSLTNVGVPQHRRRHVLLAVAGIDCDPSRILTDLSSSDTPERTVGWAIGDLLKVKARDGVDATSLPSDENRRRIDWLFDNSAFELPDRLRPPCHRDKSHTYRSVYGRMKWNEPAQTVTTGFGSMGQGCYVHPRQRRTITPHEAARLQTFPDFFRFDITQSRTAWSTLIGNAVPPFLTFRLGRTLIPLLGAREHGHIQSSIRPGRRDDSRPVHHVKERQLPLLP